MSLRHRPLSGRYGCPLSDRGNSEGLLPRYYQKCPTARAPRASKMMRRELEEYWRGERLVGKKSGAKKSVSQSSAKHAKSCTGLSQRTGPFALSAAASARFWHCVEKTGAGDRVERPRLPERSQGANMTRNLTETCSATVSAGAVRMPFCGTVLPIARSEHFAEIAQVVADGGGSYDEHQTCARRWLLWVQRLLGPKRRSSVVPPARFHPDRALLFARGASTMCTS